MLYGIDGLDNIEKLSMDDPNLIKIIDYAINFQNGKF